MDMQNIEKAELHLHLGGSWPLSYLKEVGDKEDVDNFQKFISIMNSKDSSTSYHACFKAFQLISKIVNSNEKVVGGASAVCKSLIADGVTYAEIRTSLKDLGGEGLENYLRSVLTGLENGTKRTPLNVAVLLSLRRNCEKQLAEETLRLIKKYGINSPNTDFSVKVVGLDVSDNAMLGEGNNIFEISRELHELGIPIALHLGVFRVFFSSTLLD